MKKITLLSLAVILFASITNAQITKGSTYLGGSVGGGSSRIEDSNFPAEGKSSGFSINPAMGVAIKNNLIAGINLDYTHGKDENFNGNQDNKRNGYGGGVFLRKYYPLSKLFYVFGETNVGYFYQKRQYLQTPGYSYTGVNKQNSVSLSLFPGLAIHVIKSFYLETAFSNLLQIGYAISNSTTDYLGTATTRKQKDFSIQSSLTNGSYLNIGVRFIIPKK